MRPVLALVFFCAFNAKAASTAALPDISLLRPYAEFGNQLDESIAAITGNVGVSAGGNLHVMETAIINGNVFVASGATFQNDRANNSNIAGTITTGQNLTATQNQVFSASSTLSTLSPDLTFSTLDSNQNFSAPAGTALVVDVTNLNLNGNGANGANISFSGAGDLVLNVSGSFNLGGTTGILTSDPSHVFINYTGSSGLQTNVANIVDGNLFIPTANANLAGTFFGGLYTGTGLVTLTSGATLAAVPEGSTLWLVLLGLALVSARLALGGARKPTRVDGQQTAG